MVSFSFVKLPGSCYNKGPLFFPFKLSFFWIRPDERLTRLHAKISANFTLGDCKYKATIVSRDYYLCNWSLTCFSVVPSPRRRCYKRYFTLRLHITWYLGNPLKYPRRFNDIRCHQKKFCAPQNCGKLPTGIINNQFVLLRACGTQI